MAVTYRLLESFNGTRTRERADPDNPGKTIVETESGIRDVEVEFTSDSPDITHVRYVNAVFDAEGNYDEPATEARCAEMAQGIKHKIDVGLIQ